MVLLCTSLMISDVDTFSYACWSSVCLLWRHLFRSSAQFLIVGQLFVF